MILLVPPLISIGIVAVCTTLFFYLSLQVSRHYYLPLFTVSIISLMYGISEAALIVLIPPHHELLRYTVLTIQRLLAVMSTVAMLYFVRDVIAVNSKHHRYITYILAIVLGTSLFIVLGTVINPRLIHSDEGAGLLWIAQSAQFASVSIVILILLGIEAGNTHRWLFIGLIQIGIVAVALSFAVDTSSSWFAAPLTMSEDTSLLPIGLTLFILLSTAAVVRDFVSQNGELTKTKNRLAFLAYHDGLTGLMNRQALTDRLHETISLALRNPSNTVVALLMIDLDHFKRINDGISHDIGDKVLTAFANRVKNRIRSSDSFFRIGGDEFAIILSQLKHPTDAAVVSEKILRSMDDPFMVVNETLYLGCSIGISIFPKDATNTEQLMIRADSALSAGKRERNVYRFYTKQMQLDATRKMKLLGHLRKAMAEQELSLVYQPQIAVDGSIIGTEALLRWNNHELGAISPVEFIPIAEESGLIMPIGSWVIEQACAAAHHWQTEGLPIFPVAVNLSAKQLRQEGLVPHIRETLQFYNLPPDRLHIEITESSVLDNPEAAVAVLLRLHALGVHIAIDDFGTGFSSLSYLKELPVDCVKIDRSFFLQLPEDAKSSSLVLGIISMIKGLGLTIIAEGVDSIGQVNFLRANAPITIQGFFYSKPLNNTDFIAFVRNRVALTHDT